MAVWNVTKALQAPLRGQRGGGQGVARWQGQPHKGSLGASESCCDFIRVVEAGVFIEHLLCPRHHTEFFVFIVTRQ